MAMRCAPGRLGEVDGILNPQHVGNVGYEKRRSPPRRSLLSSDEKVESMTPVDDGLPPEDAMRPAAFLGEWTVQGALKAGELPAAVSGRWRYEQAVDGWGVRGILFTEIEGMGTFEENELIGFDAPEGKIHLFSMNKYAIRDHSGDWDGEGRLAVRSIAVQEGQEVTEEITIDFVAPHRMVARVVEEANGEVVITDLSLTGQG
jgi:hypothetical protein